MVTYTVYMKELSATSAWQDITHAVVENKDIPVRKGFGSLSDGIDVGSLTLTIHMETLQDAALLHVSQKQVLVQADGVPIFEGVSYDDADIDVEERSDYVFTKLKFKPYSALFSKAKVSEDTVWMDKKICDPSDTDNSLVHLLFDMIIDNLPGQLPDILSALFNVSTVISNTKTLALVMLEAGESVEGYLTELLYQNGYAYWMELYTAIVVEPYATGRTPTVNIPITSVVANPDISQAPYVDEKKCVVRLGKIEEYTDEVVYELNGERYEDSGEPTQVQVLEPGDYYPLDSDDAPSELQADYETERENDDVEMVYAEGLSYDYMARQNDPSDASKTIPAYIVFGTHELNPTQATFQLYNNLAVNVSLRNIRVLAQTAYYRNWSERYYDEDTTATEEDEIDGIWMPDSSTAKAFVSRYRAELKSQATHVTFQTHVALQPNTLFTITGLPYQLLVRYVTKLEEGFYEYECVAYSVDTISVGTRIRVAPKKTAQDGFSPVPVHLYALGDETSPFDTSTVVSDGTSVVSDGINRLGVSSDWTLERPTPTAGQYVWQIIGYYTPPATWPTVWSDAVRLTGDKGEQGLQGLQGLQGPQGNQGIQGPTGADGATAYSHIAYADDAEGTGFSQDPTGKAYIGFYADHTEADSEDPADYAWSLIKGADGAQGIPGPTGDDGLTAYFHTAWANSSDGETDFSTTVSAGKMYIGTYSDHTQDDSTDPEDYAWVLIKGAEGVDAKGIAISPGALALSISPRGMITTGSRIFTAILQNITGDPVFSASGGIVLTQVEVSEGVYDPLSRLADFSGMDVESAAITATLTVGDVTYSATATVTKTYASAPKPMYLGRIYAVADLPTVTQEGEPLLDGDWIIYLGSDVSGSYQNGYFYEWDGSTWFNVVTDEHKFMDSDASADALGYARETGTFIYAASAIVDFILANDIVVKNTLQSQNYEESAGVPSLGWKLDGPNNIIKAVRAQLWAAIIDGSFTSDVLTTQDGESGDTFAAQSPSNTLWNEADFVANFPVSTSDEFQSASGSWNSKAFDKATRITDDYPTFYKTGGQSASVYTSNTGWEDAAEVYSYTVPSGLGPGPLWAHVNMHIDGWWTYTGVRVYRSGSVVWQASAGSGYGEFSPYVQVGDVVKCYGFRGTNIGWGVLTATVVNFRIRKTQKYSGIIALATDRSAIIQIMQSNASKYHSYSWSLTSPSFSTSSIVTKRSGSDITSTFNSLNAAFVQATGTVTVNGDVDMAIDRVRRLSSGSIEFGGAAKTLIVDSFADGTSTGVYTALSTSSITIIAQISGILTKNIIPKTTEVYDIGQENAATPSGLVQLLFRHLYLSGYAKIGGSLLTRGSTSDIGESAAKFRDLYLSGAVNAATLATSGNASVGGNQTVSGTLTVTGNLIENSTAQWSLGSQSINYGASYVLPRGVYQIYRRSAGVSIFLEVKDASTWYTVGDVFTGGGYVASDGTNMRLLNNSEDTNCTVYWRKKP